MIRKQIEWLYRPANLNVEDYAEELAELVEEIIPDMSVRLNTEFAPVTHEVFKRKCAKLTAKITEWGLIDRLAEIALIFQQGGVIYPIHRDFITWKARNIALNLPVLNCDGSNTVWYDAELTGQTLTPLLGDSEFVSHAYAVREETAKEIGRCNSNIPHWINVYVPHAPRLTHNKPRIAISVRFYPELFDIVQDGTFESLMVKH